MKWDLYQLVRELLTDYNDNFVGEPCQEIIEEVVGYLQEDLDNGGIDDDEIIDHAYEIIGNLFD